jgi:xanthine dehydrogenase YagS FAD-binding subunit
LTYRLIDIQEIEKSLSWLNKYWNRPIYPDYYNAESIDEAISILNRSGSEARIIAGGIDVVGLLKNKVIAPRVLVNIKPISNMRNITEHQDVVSIGALTLINDIERSNLVKTKYPVLVEAASSIGSPQIRNMATVGGNLCQDVRCWYYRRSPVTGISFNCKRKNQSGICYAVNGENQYHAMIGGAGCLAVYPSDMATVLCALDARIRTVDASGGRTLPIDELYKPLGNTLKANEIIQSLEIPSIGDAVKQRFLKFRMRKSIDFAIASVAAVIVMNKNIVSNARIVIGGISASPYRALEAEKLLIGESIKESIVAKIAKASISETALLNKNDYRLQIIQALIRRALL